MTPLAHYLHEHNPHPRGNYDPRWPWVVAVIAAWVVGYLTGRM